MYCSSCGSLNSDDGRFCIQCGLSLRGSQAPQRQSQPPISRLRRILKRVGIVFGCLVGLFVLLIVLASVFSDSGGDQSLGTASQVPSASILHPTIAPTPTPIPVTANALQRQQEANQVYWNEHYEDRFVEVSGVISSITEDGSNYDVKFGTENPFTNVVCKVSSGHRSKVLTLAAGQSIKVQGRVTADGVFDIVVKNCSVVRTEHNASKESGSNEATDPASAQAPWPTPPPDNFQQYDGISEIAASLTVYVGGPMSSGSGFLYRLPDSDEFIILTNAHVVEDYATVEVCWPLMQKCAYETVLNVASGDLDAAAVEFRELPENTIPGDDMKWFTDYYETFVSPYSNPSKLSWSKGDVVYAAGYPGGHRAQGLGLISDPVVTTGIIASNPSSSSRGFSFIEHGADIAPGSSGGPLLNSDAVVIGINTATNLLSEQLELATPMDGVINWIKAAEGGASGKR